ncbi:methyltransferase [Methanobrevibacter ruminantium M1]|uniref:Methyltransferase n=1 Tax=Methanobrevibacter ruminantium (strain ATCC 35063 / DSM 1093 / JCM 13430 / OCM 146 / M1) TaxID=634498 RepID=D3E491_METRM|nr:class I SAM-dependent methyltransferase [Methanobrevibacter ruminantium]ADC47352.1 methyltransferase [Methanobrevibacter ruminantium M1]
MNLEGVEKTMLLTLYTKAKHSQKPNHKFFDYMAIDIISEIDYDFSIADKDRSMQMGVISRTIVLDDMVSEYIRSHPKCTIVNIASGMDTRFNRLDNGIIKWYNVDLENSANFRLNYIKDTERVKTLAYSAMDPSWAEEIEASGDVLFIIEGLTMYLTEVENKQILDIIDENFKSCTIFTEIMPPVSVENVKEKSVEEMDAKFIWGVQDGFELRRLNPRFNWVKDVNLFDGMNVYKPITKLFTWIPFIRRRMDFIAVLEK